MNEKNSIAGHFLPGKTATELGIDTTRKFVVVDGYEDELHIGDVMTFKKDLAPYCTAIFKNKRTGKINNWWWRRMAYLEEEKDTEIEVGDIVEQTKNCSGTKAGKNYIVEKHSRIGMIIWENKEMDHGCSCVHKWKLVKKHDEATTESESPRKLISEVYDFHHKGVTIGVKLDYRNRTISLVQEKQNFQPQNFIFFNTSVELSAQWFVILEAIKAAIEDGVKRIG
jgi:hypothetical protein